MTATLCSILGPLIRYDIAPGVVMDGTAGPYTAAVATYDRRDFAVFLVLRCDARAQGQALAAVGDYQSLGLSDCGFSLYTLPGGDRFDPRPYAMPEDRVVITLLSRPGRTHLRVNGVTVAHGPPMAAGTSDFVSLFGSPWLSWVNFVGLAERGIFCAACPDDAAVQAAEAWLRAEYPGDAPASLHDAMVCVDGNSILYGAAATRNAYGLSGRLRQAGRFVRNVGTPGLTTDAMRDRAAATVDPLLDPDRAANVLVAGEGANSLLFFQPAATIFGWLMDYVDGRNAVGWKTVVVAPPPAPARFTGSIGTEWTALRAMLAVEYPAATADPNVWTGPRGWLVDGLVPSLADGLHPDDAGFATLAGPVGAAVTMAGG